MVQDLIAAAGLYLSISLFVTHSTKIWNPKSHTLSRTPITINLSTKHHSFLPLQNDDVFELEEELVIDDYVIFEEGVFDDLYLQNDIQEEPQTPKPNKKHNKPISEIELENLVLEKWKAVQVEINITKKERWKISQDLEFDGKEVVGGGRRRQWGLVPRHCETER